MSVLVMADVWDREVGGVQQQILLALADHADDRGICWPSVDRVAWKVGVSERTVQRTLKQLKASGVIEIAKEATWNFPAVYRLRLDKLPKKRPYIAKKQRGDKLSPLNEQEVVNG